MVAKQDAKREKVERNQFYAMRYKQRECERCKHRSSKPGKCKMCDGRMK